MSKHDLRARPIYHHMRESIDAHLTIVFAALAITRFIEDRAGWTINQFVPTAAATAPSTSASANTCSPPRDPLPAELRDALAVGRGLRPSLTTPIGVLRNFRSGRSTV
jgi:hypothetical protein